MNFKKLTIEQKNSIIVKGIMYGLQSICMIQFDFTLFPTGM